ncbi:hypothetical protein [Gemmobacter caeruleus]|uniref:hypothetical protein n=1 Tax=Gemmobacter caeruleus TaxID=2595004 RepID=UPI0011EDD116|nr:hypothetical protein [Gemmobacter caeruleus]
MPPRILLHAGFHKTGSSSVQAALAAHRPALLEAGWAVRLPGDAGGALLVEAARQMSRAPGIGARRMVLRALRAWLAPVAGAPGLILSCEDLAGLMPGHPGIDSYDMAPRLAAIALRAVAEIWPDGPAWLVYGTRAPGDWLASVYWQQAQHPHLAETPEDFATRLAPAADFTALLARIGHETGAPVIAAALARHGPRRLGPVEALYDLAGLPEPLREALPPVPPANGGGSAELAARLVALNRRGLPEEELTQAKRALLAAAS